MSLPLKTLDELVTALIENATNLISDAEILFSAKSYARAYALAHFAREEISKCAIIHAAGVRTLAGVKVDWKKTMRRLRSHTDKLRMEIVQNAVFCAAKSDVKAFRLAMENTAAMADYRDKRKNMSLYVGIDEGVVTRPSKVVNEHQASRTIRLAKIALGEERRIWRDIGRLQDRKVETLPEVAEVDSCTPEEIVELLEEFAPIYGQLLENSIQEEEREAR